MGRLEGKIAIVTGVGSGIGRALALRMAAEGARVVGADLEDRAEATAAAAAERMTPFACDVSQPSDVEALVSATLTRHGKLDIFCNNVGIAAGHGLLHEISIDDWDRVMNVNLRSMFLSLKYAAPPMMQSGGSIINIGSIATVRPDRLSGPYSISKAGVLQLTRLAAVDYAPYGLRVNTISPGVVETPMLAGLSEERRQAYRDRIPLARLAKPEDIAGLAVFLASDEATYFTGGSYLVAGGAELT